ncbi:hypothetical protein SUGI_0373870 [Cryptomeria japonica]|nr:hypothetical protein SUGI_0373870 [Cryptomeria japonica]
MLHHLQQEEVDIVLGDVIELPSLLEACNGCDILIYATTLVYSWLPDLSSFKTVSHFPHMFLLADENFTALDMLKMVFVIEEVI